LFAEYRIQSNAENVINLELSPEALLQALKSAISSPEVVMKLAKKNDHAVLTFEVTSQSRQGRKLQIAHDVRIYVMKPADFAKVKEPMCPEPDVGIFCSNGTCPLLL
jgi:HUS1 checkpoint protein